MYRRPTLLVALVVLLATALAGCGDDDETLAPTTTAVETTSTTAAGAPLAAECTNDDAGYTVAYPEAWDANDCQYFDPDSAEVEPNTEADVAVIVRVEAVAFDRAVEGSTEGETVQEVHTNEELEVAGHPAVLLEYTYSGQGLYPEDSVFYGYLVDLGDRTLIAETVSARTASDTDFTAVKDTLDQMVDTLTLEA